MNTYKISSITRKGDKFTASVITEKTVDTNVILSKGQYDTISIASINLATCGITSERIVLTKEQAKAIHKLAELNNMVSQIDYDGDVENWSMFFNRDFVVSIA